MNSLEVVPMKAQKENLVGRARFQIISYEYQCPPKPCPGRTWFLMFSNDLPDIIGFESMEIYAKYTSISPCLSNKSGRSEKVNLTAALEKDV